MKNIFAKSCHCRGHMRVSTGNPELKEDGTNKRPRLSVRRRAASGNDSVKKGFTLIELLVVVLIIGILSAVAFPQYQMAVFKSRVAAGMPLARALKDAQDRYYLTNGAFATDLADLDISIPANCSVELHPTWSDRTQMKCPNGSYVFRQDSPLIAQVKFIPAKQPAGVYQISFHFPYAASVISSCYIPYKEPHCSISQMAKEKDEQVCKMFSSRPGEYKMRSCGGKAFPL